MQSPMMMSELRPEFAWDKKQDDSVGGLQIASDAYQLEVAET
jgi:hypothetical protein